MTITRTTPTTRLRRYQFINMPSSQPGRTCSPPCVVAHVTDGVVAFRPASKPADHPLSFIKQHRVMFVCDTLEESQLVHGMAAEDLGVAA